MKKYFFFLIFFLVPTRAWPETGAPKNVILFIGDGMGFEHVKAAGLYLNGAPGTLNFESFPYKSEMTTRAANNPVTDSAASGTAMAAGRKVNNNIVSKKIPGDSSDLPTVLEFYKSQGKYTGLVTNADITDATPAAFGAHSTSRFNRTAIGQSYLTQSRPNVLFGAHQFFSEINAQNQGYTTVANRADLLALDTAQTSHVSGHFRSSLQMEWSTLRSANAPQEPSLEEMTTVALAVLDNGPNGFFLMVENEGIDVAGHNETNAPADLRVKYLVTEMEELSKAVHVAVAWAAHRSDTLIVVTSDHETGNLIVSASSNTPGVVPSTTSVRFRSKDHTAVKVPVYAWGMGADRALNVRDNTDIHALLLPPPTVIPPIDLPATFLAPALTPGMHRVQGGPRGFIDSSKNETAVLQFNATGAGDVIWRIFDKEGREIRLLSTSTNGLVPEFLPWDITTSAGMKVGPGVYLYRITAPGIAKTGKLVVVD